MEISVPEAAEKIGISERQVRNQIKARNIKAIKVGKRWFVDELSVLSFIKQYGDLRVTAASTTRSEPLNEKDDPAATTIRKNKKAPKQQFPIEGLRVFELSRDFFVSFKSTEDLPRVALQIKHDIFKFLGAGYYSFGKKHKILYYQKARAAYGAFLSVLLSDPEHSGRFNPELLYIQEKLLPAMSALIRKMEKSKSERS